MTQTKKSYLRVTNYYYYYHYDYYFKRTMYSY